MLKSSWETEGQADVQVDGKPAKMLVLGWLW